MSRFREWSLWEGGATLLSKASYHGLICFPVCWFASTITLASIRKIYGGKSQKQ